MPVADTAARRIVVVVDRCIVVVRREVHEYVLHVECDAAERFFEYGRADDGLVFFSAAQSQHDGAYSEQDERGGSQYADEHFHQTAAADPVVLFLVRGCTAINE